MKITLTQKEVEKILLEHVTTKFSCEVNECNFGSYVSFHEVTLYYLEPYTKDENSDE